LTYFAFSYWYTAVIVIPSVVRVDSVVTAYLRDHSGRFPESLGELLKEKYITRVRMGSDWRYFVGPTTLASHWGEEGDGSKDTSNRVALPSDHLGKIRYGICLKDLYMDGETLRKAGSGEAVLLINGKGGLLAKPYYRKVSLRWYKLMQKVRDCD